MEITKIALASGDRVIGTVRKQAKQFNEEINNANFEAVVMDVTSEEQVKEALANAGGSFWANRCVGKQCRFWLA